LVVEDTAAPAASPDMVTAARDADAVAKS